MVKSSLFIAVILTETLLLLGLLGHGNIGVNSSDKPDFLAKKKLVRTLGLTDFAIWTEARYTRHPSQTDFFTAFQDFPGSLEHFPAGAIIAPAKQNRREAK